MISKQAIQGLDRFPERTLSRPRFVRCISSCFLLGALLAPANLSAEPYRPADDAVIVERLPTGTDGVTNELRDLRRNLAADPENLELAVTVARRYIQLNRAEADPRTIGYAQAALQPWWAMETPPAQVHMLRAVLRQSRHDFDGALDDLAQILRSRPRQAQALLSQAFILQAVGRIDEARSSCAQLPATIGALVAATCLARVESLSGKATQAYERLSRALAETAKGNEGLRLWALTNLAEIAQRRGDSEAAETHFRAALAIGRRNAYLLDAFADLLLDQGRADEVRALFKNDARADGHLLRLALAERALKHPGLARHIESLRARFEASLRRGERLHLREEARFELELRDRPERALELATENWHVQREPWDARLVLEAALAAGRPEAAQEVVSWMETTKLEDRRLRSLAAQLKEARS